MASSSAQKDINEIKRLVIANGFKVVPNGKGHMKLLDKAGRVVVDDNGPVIFSGTSSETRGRDMAVHRLMGVGALKEDPWGKQKPMTTEQKKGRPDPQSPEMRQKRREADAARSREREENTRKLRSRIEPFIMLIGGWEKKGVQAEIGLTAWHYLRSHHRVEVWTTEESAKMAAHTLKKGETLSDKSVAAWNLFMDEIERAGDTKEARRERYFELVAEGKGLPKARLTNPAPGPKAETPPEPEVTAEVTHLQIAPPQTNGGQRYKTPTLALRALQEMTAGAGLSVERRREALAIAEEILDMEIASMIEGVPDGVRVVH